MRSYREGLPHGKRQNVPGAVTVDLTGVGGWEDFWGRIQTAFGFSDGFGKNWDAFWDVLSKECPASKVTVVGANRLPAAWKNSAGVRSRNDAGPAAKSGIQGKIQRAVRLRICRCIKCLPPWRRLPQNFLRLEIALLLGEDAAAVFLNVHASSRARSCPARNSGRKSR